MRERLFILAAALATLASVALLARCSGLPCQECSIPCPECPSVDVEARDVQIRALAEMDPDARTEEIAILLDECLR